METSAVNDRPSQRLTSVYLQIQTGAFTGPWVTGPSVTGPSGTGTSVTGPSDTGPSELSVPVVLTFTDCPCRTVTVLGFISCCNPYFSLQRCNFQVS